MKYIKSLVPLLQKRLLLRVSSISILIFFAEIMVAKLFELSPYGVAIIIGLTVLLAPSFAYAYFSQKREENRYTELTDYMEQMISSYRENRNIARALADCEDTFEEGSVMKELLQKAIHVRVTGAGVGEESITRESLRVIENQFPSRRLKLLHDFLTKTEQTGGNHTAMLNILLEDLQTWRGRSAIYQKKKQKIKIECLISTLLAAVFSSIPTLLLKFSGLEINIADEVLYQVSATTALSLFLFTANQIMKKSSGSWLDSKDNTEKHEKSIQKQYDFVVNYSRKKAVQEAIIPLVMGICMAAIALTAGQVVGGSFQMICIVFGGLIMGFFLIQVLNRRNICRKKVRKYVEQEFPYWLLSVTLLLQTESVYQAVLISQEEITGVLQTELSMLSGGIYQNPTSLVPYRKFFKDFEVSAIKQGMRVLYAIQSTGVEGMEQQLYQLTKQNNDLMDVAEKITFENRLAGMSALRFLPQLISCFHMLLNLGLTMLLVFGMFGSIS